MYGLTQKSITDLVPLAKMWRNAPEIKHAVGCTTKGFQMEERAYQLSAQGPMLSFSVEANAESPLVNPCFVVKHWNEAQPAEVLVDGEKLVSHGQVRQGLTRDTQGKLMLVVWIEMHATEPVKIKLSHGGI